MRPSAVLNQVLKRVLIMFKFIVAELIGIQEKLEANTLSPEQIEIKSDAEVNAYWKNHEDEIHVNQERKNSRDAVVDFHKEEEKIVSDEPVVAEVKAETQEVEVTPV